MTAAIPEFRLKSVKWTRAKVRAMLAEIKLHLSKGKTDLEVCEELAIPVRTYNELKRELMRQETQALYSKSTEDVFLEYTWLQKTCIQELNDVIESAKAKKVLPLGLGPGGMPFAMPAKGAGNHAAIVQAVRAKSEIADKIIKTGQDMGILERAPERKLILAGVAVANLDNNKLRKLIANEVEGLARILKRYGDDDMLGNKALPPPDEGATDEVAVEVDVDTPDGAFDLPPMLGDEDDGPDFARNDKPWRASAKNKAKGGRARHRVNLKKVEAERRRYKHLAEPARNG